MTGLTSPNYLRPGAGPQTDATASQTGSGPQTGPATHAGATASRLGTKDRPHPAGGAEAASQVPLKVMGRGTLSRQLVLRVTALVALVAIALSAITAFAIQQILVGQTDQQLRELAARPQKISDRDPLGATGGIGRQDGLLLYRVITDPYTGLTVDYMRARDETNPVVVDHVVSLWEAWATGAWAWTPEQRVVFANDPLNLVATTYDINELKGPQNVARWHPTTRPQECEFALRVIATKANDLIASIKK